MPAVSNWLLFFSDATTGTNKAKNSSHVGGSCRGLNSTLFGPAGSMRQFQIPTEVAEVLPTQHIKEFARKSSSLVIKAQE